METKIGYKVVSLEDGIYVSAVINPNVNSMLKIECDKFTVEYKIGEFVEPKAKGTCLFVFSDLDSARYFRNCEAHSRLSVFECEYAPKKYKKVPLVEVCNMFRYWRNRLNKKKYNFISQKYSIPYNTDTASKVKLIKEV